MDPSALDPNKTMISGSPLSADPNKTQAMAGSPFGSPGGDLNRTQAVAVNAAPFKGVQIEVTPSREATMANGPAREQFLLEIRGESIAPALPGMAPDLGVRTPMNLSLVIDRSGSMEGTPLQFVKEACNYVVDLLTPNDILSIVTFETMAEVLMPPQAVTNKAAIKQGIAAIQVGNTTNLYDGVAQGLQQIAQFKDATRATRVIVLTDGDPTSGIKDFDSLTNLAGGIRERGVSATFLGFGPDYNEELLHAMAKRAGGNYYYIPQPQLIPEIFRTELQKLGNSVTHNMRLELKPSRWVDLKSPALNDGALIIADAERGSTIQQVFDFEFNNHPLGWYRVASGILKYDDLTTGNQQSVDVDFVMEFTADAARYSSPQNPKVSSAAQVALVSKVVEKTVMGMKTGIISPMQAVQDLQKTQALLLNEGRHQEAQEVTMALRALQSGDQSGAEKTLLGTMLHLDQGKTPQ